MSLAAEYRRVLVLGVVAGLLGGYAYFTAPERPGPIEQAGQRTEQPVFTFQPDDVTRIEVLFEGKRLAGQRTPEGWKQEGAGGLLPSAAVDDFLGNLTKLVNLGEVEGGAEQISEYGLEPPRFRITLWLQGGEKPTLTLGKHNPVNTSLYAQVNGSSRVVLVGSVVSWDTRKLLMAAGEG